MNVDTWLFKINNRVGFSVVKVIGKTSPQKSNFKSLHKEESRVHSPETPLQLIFPVMMSQYFVVVAIAHVCFNLRHEYRSRTLTLTFHLHKYVCGGFVVIRLLNKASLLLLLVTHSKQC